MSLYIPRLRAELAATREELAEARKLIENILSGDDEGLWHTCWTDEMRAFLAKEKP